MRIHVPNMAIKPLQVILVLMGVVPFKAYTYGGWKPPVSQGMYILYIRNCEKFL